ncbi:MAG: AMP-binding protein [Kiritimatiellae bacterium]|nr:AMP-binding protein [Kiritimatiellia bacterium]
MTLKESLEHSVQKHPDKTLLRFKRAGKWVEWTYAQFQEQVRNAAELLYRACHVRASDRVMLLAANSPEWAVVHYAITGISASVVHADPHLKEQEVAHILNDSGATVIVADLALYTLIREVEPRCLALRHVVLFNPLGRDMPNPPPSRVRYHEFESLMAAHAAAAKARDAAYTRVHPKDDDIAAFLYTSGTTGRQKGAMLSHANFMGNFRSLDAAIDILPDDNFLVILPFFHAFAFTTCLVTPIAAGVELSLVESLRTIGENIRETHPTIILGVPLLLEKMRDKAYAAIAASKVGSLMWRLGMRGPIRRKVADSLGGRIRLIISGGAPIDFKVLEDFDALGLHPREGYGLTECAPVLCLSPYTEPPRRGSCGKVLPFVEMTVLDPNPEGVGVLAVKGANVMKGYYNNPSATADVFRDGWFLTGDLGYMDADNFVYITGRAKSLIVNREGKNIYPEEVETQIDRSPYIRECVVLGYREPGENVGEHVGVIVCPNEEAVAAREKAEGRKYAEADIVALLRAEVKAQAENLAAYKRPRRIQVRWEEFNKTSTGKIKRYLYQMAASEV